MNKHRRFTFRRSVDLPIDDLDVTPLLNNVFSDYLGRISAKKILPVSGRSEEPVKQKLKADKNCHADIKLSDFVKEFKGKEIEKTLLRQFCSLKSKRQLASSRKKDEDGCTYLTKPSNQTGGVQQKIIPCEDVKSNIQVLTKDITVALISEPDHVLFDHYIVGLDFKKCCVLRNIGVNLVRGRIVAPSTDEWQIKPTGNFLLSRGLTITFTVIYRPPDLRPRSDFFSIAVTDEMTRQHRLFKIDLIAKRETPKLIGFQEDEESNKYIHVGHGFVNSSIESTVKLTNIGSMATFVITNDFKSKFDEATQYNCDSFSMNPHTFTLDKNESIHINLELSAKWNGHFLQEMTILCTDDDKWSQTFRLIGTAEKINTETIVFDALDKDYAIDKKDDGTADYYIDLMKITPSGNVNRIFQLTNTSCVPLTFHWEWGESWIDKDRLAIPEECTQVIPSRGVMQGCGTTQFNLSCTMNKALPYQYRAILRLVIDGLNPECLDDVEECLLEKRTDETDDSRQTVSFYTGNIEVWLEVVLPVVEVNPCLIELTCLDYQTVSVEVTLKSWSCDDVHVRWLAASPHHSLHPLKIDPNKFILTEGNSINCAVSVECSRWKCRPIDSIEDSIVCVLNSGEGYVELPVKLNFLTSAQESIKSSSTVHLYEDSNGCIDLIHLAPVSRDRLSSIFKNTILNINANDECNMVPVCDSYICSVVDSAIDSCLTTMGLVLGTRRWEDDVCWVIGDVRSCRVHLIPSDINLFLFHQFHDKNSVVIRNQSLIDTKYRWGDSYGTHSHLVKIWLSNSQGTLAARSDTSIDLFFFPTHCGEIDDWHLPCFIENVREPIVLNLKGTVEALKIKLVWTTGQGLFQTVWDPWSNESCQNNLFSDYTDESLDLCRLHEVSEEDSATKLNGDLKENVSDDCSSKARRRKVEKDLPKLSVASVVREDELHRSSAAAVRDSYLLFTDNLSRQDRQDSMGKVLSSVFNEKAIRFTLTVGEKKMQSINLKNLTPIKTSFSIRPEIFGTMEEAPEYPSYLIDDDYSDTSKWSKFMKNKAGVGLYLDVEPKVKELNSYQDSDVVVTATPDVWGEYMDVLVVKIGNLSCYSIPIMVEAFGQPVGFTFDPRPEPHFRFGTLAPSDQVVYEVTLKNNTYVPLKIGWTTYFKPVLSQSFEIGTETEELPFGLAVDWHNPSGKHFCKLDIIEYLGLQQNNPYKVDPGVTYLQAYEEVRMSLSVSIPGDAAEGLLEGTCVGIIYQDQNLRSKWRSLCRRKTGLSKGLYKLKLTTHVELPTLNIIKIDSQQHCFIIMGSELSEKGVWEEFRRYKLKNTSKAQTKISLELDEPFALVKVLNEEGDELSADSATTYTVFPKQVLTLVIQLKVTLNIIPRTVYEDVESVEYIGRHIPLLIRQPHINKSQTMELSFKIIYPFFKLSIKRLVFGAVCVGETKKKLFRITAVSGREKFLIVRKGQNSLSPFSFSPFRGILDRGSYSDISVSFTPRESTGYLDEFVINTWLPQCTFTIIVEGVGTWNNKFLQIIK